MRLIRPLFALVFVLLLWLAGGTLYATTFVTVGTSSTTGSNCGALAAGQTCTLTSRITDDTGASYQAAGWSFSPTVTGAVQGTPSYNATTGVNTNTYTAPSAPITSRITVTVKVSAPDGTSATAQIILIPPSFTISVNPSAVTLYGGQTQQFTATVSGFSQTGVVWSLSSAIGSIDSTTGLYTAPAAVSVTQTVTVRATSTFDNTTVGTATVTLQPPAVITVTVSPSSVSLSPGGQQQFSATVTNTANTAVNWAISPQIGSIDSTGLYTAPVSVTASTRVTVTASSQADASKLGTATVTVTPVAGVSVTVSPASVTLTTNQGQQFTATVTNAANTAVTWSISPQVGTIDDTGYYMSPAQIAASQRITVTAISLQDGSKTGTATITLSPVVDVGTGAPTPSLAAQFRQAYQRNGFAGMVSVPPTGRVTAYGTGGYIQLFQDANKTAGVTYALVTQSTTVASTQPDGTVVSVVQIWGALYSYFSSIGVGTAGFPIGDTQNCPSFDASNSCTYQFFDKSYVLFAYQTALSTGTNFAISGTFYTEWNKLGGIGGPGRPLSAPTTVTASTGTTASTQAFSSGVIYSITSGVNKGQIFGVTEPIYDQYVTNGGAASRLGLPTAEAITLASGARQQNFEGGVLVYTPTGGGSTQYPIASVGVAGVTSVPGASISLKLGDTLTLTATPYDTTETAAPDRPVSWSSSNSKVISIQASGPTAVLTAAGAGSASVYASSGGVSSSKFYFVVTAPCCQVGDGTPVTVQQSFAGAVTRNQLAVVIPVASPAARVGNGYVQMVQVDTGAGTGPVIYMIAKGDQIGSAYVVGGSVLTRYQLLGGPGGSLGYPTSDQSKGGTQLFANSAALAGNPVYLVTAPILTKWAAMGYETGAAGVPAGDAAQFTTFAATSGAAQVFAGGVIYAGTGGSHAGQSFLVSGLILAAYAAAGGVTGDLGMPVTDEFSSGASRQQNFEGGYATYSTGDAAAQVHLNPRTPTVLVTPSSIYAGGSATLAVAGFPNNSTLRVSVTGRTDFLITTTNGAYSWSMLVPLTASGGAVAIHAVDTHGTSTADGTLTVKGAGAGRFQFAKLQGDNQSGVSGGLLPLPLQVALADTSGTPIAGVTVTFQPSPGAQVSAASAVTDSLGRASTYLRLPAAAGTAAVNVSASSVTATPTTFYAVAAASTLSNFPAFSQAADTLGKGSATISQKGALLNSVASILRYRQNRAELPSPNGTAYAPALNQFLTSYCAADSKGQQVCDGFLANPDSGEQIVNLWRAAEFTGSADVEVETPTLSTVVDWLAQGEPLLLSLELSRNGTPAGGHFVDAIGIAADGSVVIQDPNPLFARTNLNDYLNGFSAGGATWTATLAGVVRFVLRTPSATRFMVGELSQPAAFIQNSPLSIASPSGACGRPLLLMDAVDSTGHSPTAGALLSRIAVCDGTDSTYQVDIGSAQAYRAFITDLASGGSLTDVSGQSAATFSATRPKLNLVLAAQSAAIFTGGVVNAADFTARIAPGGLMAIFGSGLFGASAATTVDVDGIQATVLAATPFQVNAQLPASLAPGTHTLRVVSTFGAAQQTITVAALAPAIFLVGDPPVGVVANQDYTLNASTNPLTRGQVLIVYATGLGTVSKNGSFFTVDTPVTAVVNGAELPVSYAGLSGYTGVYQVNVIIPTTTPPGLGISFTLKQGGLSSNSVSVALQ